MQAAKGMFIFFFYSLKIIIFEGKQTKKSDDKETNILCDKLLEDLYWNYLKCYH